MNCDVYDTVIWPLCFYLSDTIRLTKTEQAIAICRRDCATRPHAKRKSRRRKLSTSLICVNLVHTTVLHFCELLNLVKIAAETLDTAWVKGLPSSRTAETLLYCYCCCCCCCWFDLIWFDLIWFDLISLIWFDLIWDLIWFVSTCKLHTERFRTGSNMNTAQAIILN